MEAQDKISVSCLEGPRRREPRSLFGIHIQVRGQKMSMSEHHNNIDEAYLSAVAHAKLMLAAVS